jgi:hypothetical protein
VKSIIIIEVEHDDTTDGLTECLFDLGVGSQLDPHNDPEWPTARDGATWPAITGGQSYRVTDYAVRVDLPSSLLVDSDMPSRDAIFKACAATPREILSLIEPDPWRTQ